jgi:hypothetical protein
MADIETVSSVLQDTSLNWNGNMKGNEEYDLDESACNIYTYVNLQNANGVF